jgi:D-beta-D-heptose 7-phosphate kinase / D-beta-D-heptose 1-phosphate adenosyltransferase
MLVNTNLVNFIDAFADLKVLVIGEAMLDSYLIGDADRLCREAPVPVVSISQQEYVPGGAANAAVNLSSLGAQAVFLSVTGDDAEGDVLRRSLENLGVSTENIISDPSRQTMAKQRVIGSSHMVVRFDQGSTEELNRKTETALINRLKELFQECDAVLVSDYGYGILTPHVIRVLAQLQSGDPRVFVVDSKRLSVYRDIDITAVKPNYSETLQLLGLEKQLDASQRIPQISRYGERLLDLTGAHIAAVTLDQEGALVFERGCTPYRTYARPAPHSRAAGAGDTFASALTLSLAAGAHLEASAELASAASSIVVEKDGTAVCYALELRNYFSTAEKFVTDAFQLAARMSAYRKEERRIVFTNGCFDLLHRGHINYLNQAKSFGDILIIGLNSDQSVSRLKGPNRPINSLEDRAQILAALSCVDHIIPFDGDTPHDLIRVIKPEVYVKGGDYTVETLPEAALVNELGGKLEILPYLDDHSTTSIIERIRELYVGDQSGPENEAGKSNYGD